jgi:hypothetical protein
MMTGGLGPPCCQQQQGGLTSTLLSKQGLGPLLALPAAGHHPQQPSCPASVHNHPTRDAPELQGITTI